VIHPTVSNLSKVSRSHALSPNNPQNIDLSCFADDYADPAGYRGPGGQERREEGVRRTEFFAELLQKGGGAVEVYEDIQPKRRVKASSRYPFASF